MWSMIRSFHFSAFIWHLSGYYWAKYLIPVSFFSFILKFLFCSLCIYMDLWFTPSYQPTLIFSVCLLSSFINLDCSCLRFVDSLLQDCVFWISCQPLVFLVFGLQKYYFSLSFIICWLIFIEHLLCVIYYFKHCTYHMIFTTILR